MSPQTAQAGTGSAALDRSIAQAADILDAAAFPLVAGLGTDADGLRAGLMLAERLRGAIDHAAGEGSAAEMRAFADAGQMNTTPAEARHRADLVVLAGPTAVAYALEVGLFDDSKLLYDWRKERTVIVLGADHPNDLGHLTTSVMAFGPDPGRLGSVFAAIRAKVGGRALGTMGQADPTAAEIATAADLMKGASFGVFVYDPAAIGVLGIEQAQGLVKDLNAGTRFSALAVPGPLNARTSGIVSAWTTGFPLRLGFGRGYPEYDAWTYRADRLVASGETDAVLWVAPLGPDLPGWAARPKIVALVAPGTAVAADVVIEVGRPGIEHGGSVYDAKRDGFTYVPAAAPAPLPTVAAVIGRIAETIGSNTGEGAARCSFT